MFLRSSLLINLFLISEFFYDLQSPLTFYTICQNYYRIVIKININ